MLIGGDGSSNEVITLGWCFSWLLLFRARLPFALIGDRKSVQCNKPPWNGGRRLEKLVNHEGLSTV